MMKQNWTIVKLILSRGAIGGGTCYTTHFTWSSSNVIDDSWPIFVITWYFEDLSVTKNSGSCDGW